MLIDQYQKTRKYSETLCEPLKVEDYIPQAEEFTSPPKWHLAHTTWFFEEMILSKLLPNYAVFDSQFRYLFNSYYHSVGEKAARAQRGLMTRPTVEQVYQYRQYVDDHMQQLFTEELSEQILALITLGINHEQQHQELLLTDLKYTFSLNPTHPVYRADFNLLKDHNEVLATGEEWIKIDEGTYEVGHMGDGFCYDNEYGRHKVYLEAFEISASLVTNGEYIEFIDSGGYSTFNYWLDDGWSWIDTHKINSPLYWKKIEDEWYYYTLSGLKKVDKQAILAHVSYYEAFAFAQWREMRLPSEFEWEIASSKFNWGKRWEWTSSAYLPYPNFKVSEGAVGEYNGKFMINQMVLRGASVATAQNHSRATYRNFFHPHFQWQYSGIRLVK